MSDPPLTQQHPSRRSTVGYGGQAVTEGVMMRSPRHVVVVCRRPDGTLAHRARRLGATPAMRLRRVPILRGVLTMRETLELGFWAINFAQGVSLGIERDDEPAGSRVVNMITATLALSIVLGGFFLVPFFAMRWIEDTSAPAILSVIAEGLLRLLMMLGYFWLIGRLPNVRRLFQFHGAEHKTIAAWEAGDALTPERVARYSRAHPRCGTSFLLVVAIVAFITFTAVGNQASWLMITSRIVLVPVIVAIAYEVIRIGGLYRGNRIVAAMFTPNLWLQALTTREPDESQVVVAIAAMEAVLELEGEQPASAA